MRKEPFLVGHYVHVYNRGNRKQEIVRDDLDRRHFLHALYYLNSATTPTNPFQSLRVLKETQGFQLDDFRWPLTWRPREPLVSILSYILRDNHYHLLLKETQEGGTTAFMRKFATSLTNRFNTRYGEVGQLFQGSYKARRVDTDNHLRYLPVYIQVRNAFEIYPGGVASAIEQFPQAYAQAFSYPYSSLAELRGTTVPSIIEPDELLGDAYADEQSFRQFAKETVQDVRFDEKSAAIEIGNN